MANINLTSAKKAKNDEFYTQFVDIQKEVEAYLEYDKDTFRGKVVYCNCDDPYESNFFKYFVLKFKELGLKKLITTSYKPSPIANTEVVLQPSLLPEVETKVISAPQSAKGRPKATANRFIITEVDDYITKSDGSLKLENIAAHLQQNVHNEWAPLEGDGDFRSDESIALLRESDIVVTNPPFSLYREYVSQLVEYGKKFLILGNKNTITYKEIFPLIKENKMWVGTSGFSRDILFIAPKSLDLSDKPRTAIRIVDGVTYLRSPSVWFTNLDHGRRHQPLSLMSMADNLKHSKHATLKGKTAYDHYDNYDAIEVPFTDAIPSDYDGVMGVPISFLDRYSPEQFEIVGSYNNGEHGLELGASKSPIIINGRETLWNGPVINKKPLYKRIIIRRRRGVK